VLLARADARMLADKSRARPRPASEAGKAEPAREGSDLVGADLP